MLKLQQPPPPENYNAEMCESALVAQRKAWEHNITCSIPNKKLVLEQITILSALSSSSTPSLFTETTVDRCAYCETQFDNSFGLSGRRINLFNSRAPEKEKLYAWTNLVLACGTCHMYKGHKHPLDDYNRLQLLNPYTDAPELHLVALSNFHYGALTEIGRTSINVYGLNRNSLIAARRANTNAFPGFLVNLKHNEGKTPLPKIDYDLSTIFDKRRYK